MAKFKFIKINPLYGFLALLVAITACCTPFVMATSARAIGCDDVKIIFARGSGEKLDDVNYRSWQSNLAADLQGANLKYSFYELGSIVQDGFQYPAIVVGGSLEGMFNMIGAKISAGESYQFGESVNQGINELQAYVRKTSLACPNTKFVLGGYSQGGMVISKALERINSDKIIYAATFGDPKLYLPEGEGWNPDACQGKNLSNYRAYVPDCHTAEGVLEGLKPYQKTDLIDKLGAWCNSEDIMCGANVNLFNLLGGHTSYNTEGLYQNAAILIANKIAQAFPKSGMIIHTRTDTTTQDTAIVIDSSGSMSPLIEEYKTEAKRLAKKTFDKGGRVALYEYRDLFEDPKSTIQHCDFSCTYDQFTAELDKIHTDRGGDIEESAMSALLQAMNDLSWKPGAVKSAILLTDAGYHAVDYDGTTLADVIKRSLEIDPVNVYTIAPEDMRSTYAALTAGTSGNFFNTETDLTKVADYLTNRPIVILPFNKYSGTPGDTITFDASESVAQNGIDHYEWDLDFDGVFETKTDTPIVSKTYPNLTTGMVQVKVVDKQNLISTMSAEVVIKNPEALVQITQINNHKRDDGTYDIDFTTSENTSMVLVVVNDNIVGRTDSRSLNLSNISRVTTVTLVPYSNTGVRGTSHSVTITPTINAPNTGA